MSRTVAAAQAELRGRLAAAGIESAPLEARRIMAAALGVAPDRVSLMSQEPVPEPAEDRLAGLAARRSAREPLAHILGERDFWKLSFRVTADVLDPRPETETLVEVALAEPFGHVLDLGTGSGCILLSLLAERPEARGMGTDTSAAALALAAENAARHGLEGRARLVRADWLEGVAGQFDLIVSNPPYIAEAEMAELAPELAFEPRAALTDGADGLTAYRIIARDAPAHLAPGGRLMVEVGWRQGPEVAALFRAAGLEEVTIQPDLDGRDRVVRGNKPLQFP
ncbi:MAG: peptide chain release factor N(5)-glutamine methyltransferase [Roseovarius sp.]